MVQDAWVAKETRPISETHPELAAEAAGWNPTMILAGTDKKMAWRCKLGHTYLTQVRSRARGSGCPFCSNNAVLAGFNDLATTHPELAAEADGWDPTTMIAGTGKKLAWRCNKGHKWIAAGNDRTRWGGCPVCTNQLVLAGFNDLATTHPELAAEADGWDPTTMIAGTDKKVAWRCGKGHKWITRGADRVKGRGRPVCGNRAVLAGFNDLATTHPELAAEADGWDPTMILAGTNKQLQWRCGLGHEWVAKGISRFNGNGCPFCSNKAVLTGFNDLATTHPELAAEADGWDPTTMIAGTNKKLAWRCGKGHKWITRVNSRSQGNGCPTCALTGFSPGLDGYLYFLRHELWGLLQIGISNAPGDRLSTHRRSGWQVIELRGPMPGDVAYGWEQSILKALTDRDVSLSPAHIAGTFSGYTESWIEEDFPASSLKELIALVHGDEDTEN